MVSVKFVFELARSGSNLSRHVVDGQFEPKRSSDASDDLVPPERMIVWNRSEVEKSRELRCPIRSSQ
jgi:hypothetical protein